MVFASSDRASLTPTLPGPSGIAPARTGGRGMNRATGARAAGFLAAAMCAFATTAFAFDTGPHFDITEDVLRSEGFSSAAIRTVQSANFLVDFYEFIGNPKLKVILDAGCRARVQNILTIADSQHFDSLGSTVEVAKRWDTMLDATKTTAEAKTKSGDVLDLLALLGSSLHNVQDFYAHSNWVEGSATGPPLGRGPLAKYGSHPTWLSMDRADREALDIYTHKPSIKRTHGDWNSDSVALNKDWEGRPHHADAYLCAYFATRQWLRLFRTFVNESGTWSQMQRWSASSFNPDRDWDYARKISFYGGHWNGNGGPTGLKDAFSARTAGTSPDLLVNAVLNYMGGRCLTKNPSALRSEVESLLTTWGAAPYRGPVTAALPSAAPESLRFVRLKVHRIDAVDADDGFLGGDLDWYGRSEIAGQRYWSGLIDEHDNFHFDRPPYAPWAMTKAIPPSMSDVPIVFQLMELDYSEDDHVDINPKSGPKSLVFRYSPATGQLRGDVSGPTRFTTEGRGDCDCARVEMSVSRLVGTCLR